MNRPLDDETRRDLQLRVVGKASLRDMTPAEQQKVLDALKAEGFVPSGGARARRKPASRGDVRFCHVLWGKLHRAGAVDQAGAQGLNAFVRARFAKAWGAAPIDIDQMRDSAPIFLHSQGNACAVGRNSKARAHITGCATGAICRQWRVTAAGRFLGLDYAAVQAGLELAGIVMTPDLTVQRSNVAPGIVTSFDYIQNPVDWNGGSAQAENGIDALIGAQDVTFSSDANACPEKIVARPRLSGLAPYVNTGNGTLAIYFRIVVKRTRDGVVTTLRDYIEPFWQFVKASGAITQLYYAGRPPSAVVTITQPSFLPGDTLTFEYYYNRTLAGAIGGSVALTSYDLEVEEYYR